MVSNIPQKRRLSWRACLIIVAKLTVTVGLLYVVFGSVTGDGMDLDSMLGRIAALDVTWIFAALALFYLQFLIAGWRQIIAIACLGARIGPWRSVATIIIGFFFGQVFATFIGGDAVRVLRISRDGVSMRDAGSAVLIDRAFGFIAILVLVLAFLPLASEIVTSEVMRTGLYLGAAAASGCVGGFFLFGMMPEVAKRFRYIGPVLEISSASRHVVRQPKRGLQLLFLSLGVQGGNVLIAWILGIGLGADWSLLEAMALVPMVMLIASLPISFAGWGVREKAMVSALGFLGIADGVALATSLVFGLCLLVASLPGAVLWWIGKRQPDDQGLESVSPETLPGAHR